MSCGSKANEPSGSSGYRLEVVRVVFHFERATDAVKAAAYPDVRVSEYKGGNAVDVTAGASGSSASANSGSVHLRPFSC